MLSNITSINLDLQTQGSALVAKQINALVSPARRIYVFGTATDAFPYFSTFANALTYANSLTPSTTNPVSIVLLSKSDNTPVTITGNDDWYALCLDGIYVSSPYREIFSTTTLPTTLPKGMRVMYEDANGVESLWVGNADGVALPASGTRLMYFSGGFQSTNPLGASVTFNQFPLTLESMSRSTTGTYQFVFNGILQYNSSGIFVTPVKVDTIISRVASLQGVVALDGGLNKTVINMTFYDYAGALVDPSSGSPVFPQFKVEAVNLLS